MSYGNTTTSSINPTGSTLTNKTNFTPLANAIQAGLGANLQANTQADQAAVQGLNQQQAYNTTGTSAAIGYQQPTYNTGQQALSQAAGIAGAEANGQDTAALNSPEYQAILQQGINATQQTGAATGNLYSGGQQLALQNTGENLASSYLNNIFNQNSQLASLGQQAGTQASSYAYQGNQAAGNTAANIGNVNANADLSAGQLQNQADISTGQTQVAQSTVNGLGSTITGMSNGLIQNPNGSSTNTTLPVPAAVIPQSTQGYSAGPTPSTSGGTTTAAGINGASGSGNPVGVGVSLGSTGGGTNASGGVGAAMGAYGASQPGSGALGGSLGGGVNNGVSGAMGAYTPGLGANSGSASNAMSGGVGANAPLTSPIASALNSPSSALAGGVGSAVGANASGGTQTPPTYNGQPVNISPQAAAAGTKVVYLGNSQEPFLFVNDPQTGAQYGIQGGYIPLDGVQTGNAMTSNLSPTGGNIGASLSQSMGD